MSRRISRPANNISPKASKEISQVRRAQITSAVNSEMNKEGESKILSSIAHSPSFKKTSLSKIS